MNNPGSPLITGPQKPGMVQAIAIMTLINGILNILYGLSVTAGIVLGTLFVGIICAPVTILPVVLGIFEIIYAQPSCLPTRLNLSSRPRRSPFLRLSPSWQGM
jgi:hypothetical protein